MASLLVFSHFRIAFDLSADSEHDATHPQFSDDITSSAGPDVGRYLMAVFTMKDSAGGFTTRERGMFGTHWINTTSGDLDTTWTTSDFTSVESALQTFWNTAAGQMTSEVRLEELRWYKFGPGITKPNPTVRIVTPTKTVGSITSTPNVHQVGSTVTLRTALRKHWGRFYMPLAPLVVGGTGGQMGTVDTDNLANAARTFLTAPTTPNGIVPVVWSRTRKMALGITDIEVDSVPDIIRRRRPRTTAYRKILSA